MRVQASRNFRWLQERTGCALTPDASAIEAVDAAGRIRGMVAYDLPTRNAAHMHVCLEGVAAARALLRPAFAYLFEQVGFSVALGTVRESNTRSLQIARSLGFQEVYRITDGWAEGEDLILFEMHKRACHWLSARKRKAA